MPEKYGVSAQFVPSMASTPVDTSTNIVFIGAADIEKVNGWKDMDLINRPIYISSYADYEKKLGGGSPSENFNLTEAAEAAFQVVGISGAYFINVHDPDKDDEDLSSDAPYLGSAADKTGIYAVLKLWPNYGAVPNLICCPGRTSGEIVNALKTVATKCNGHWDGLAVFDVIQSASQVVNGNVQPSAVTNSNKFENGIAVWPSVKSISGHVISGAAVVCALYAANDAARNNIPVRSIGNTVVSILGACLRSDGKIVSMEESDATEIQQNGIVTFLNAGGGTYVTWGDHTSAMSNGTVTDERARFDSNIRVLQTITNRFQQKYRFDIDNPMTLTMRNSVIQEENDYLATLKSVGAIIGNAACQFKAEDNPKDNVALGQFVWSIDSTVTPPMKYAQLNVGFTSAGYSVYYEA